MKDFLFNAYMSARLCLITPEYYCERWLRAALTITLVLCVSATASAYECPQDPPPARTDTYQGFLGRVHELNGQQLPYRLFVPKGYDATKPYPLVLFLHHAGLAGTDSHNESGWDNCVQLTSEIGSGGYGGVFTHSAVDRDGKRFDTQERYPHFVLAPHANSPAYGFGGGVAGSATAPEHPTRPLLLGILEQVQKEFNIDPGRLYVTGISMGCYGTWDLIMRRPDMFAAASPQSCRGDPNKELLARLKDMPIWSMCGTNDSYFSGAQAMADGMTAIGATEFEFTAMQGVGHSIGNRGYDYPGFIDWMFEQRLAGTQPPGSGGAGGTGGAAGGAGTAGAAGNGGAPNGQAGQAMGGGAAAGGGTSAGAPGSASGGSASGQGGGAAAAPGVTPGGGDDVATTQSGCSVGRASSSSTPLALILALSLGAAAWRPRPARRRRLGKKVHPLQTL
jgi:dienelactone hydrolase